MKNLHTKRFALAIFGVFAICFSFVASRSGRTISDLWSVLTIAYKTIPLVLLVVGIFVSYAWRWKVFRGWLVPFPDLNGTWQGTIQTTWINPETGNTPPAIPAIVTIKQSFTRISCILRTAESASYSCFSDFWLDDAEQVRKLGYSYHSEPLPSVIDRSPPHKGTMIFELIGDPVEKLKGIYWTSRKTTGEVVLTFRQKSLLQEFPSDLGKHPVSGKEA